MEGKGGEVEETTNLILDLKNISEVLSWRDRTVGAIDSVLP